ncbi:hypothetical protein ACFVJH_05600 [Streptomyces decoyicus]|uniref:hypothetical protein n=1 Tax=Streptomyces decoyicus TaxID=249567 RepID=UPI00362951A9
MSEVLDMVRLLQARSSLDTHRDVHVVVALSTLGVVMGTASLPATAVGYRALWEWASRLGTVRRAGMEGAS